MRTYQPPSFEPFFEGDAPKQGGHDVCDPAEALYQKSALLAGLLDSIPDRVFFKDCAGVYLGFNPEFARFVGRPREEIVGRTDYELFSQEDADFHRRTDRSAMEVGPIRFETWIEHPDGSRALWETIKAPLRSVSGEKIGLVGVSREITERKQTEQALTRSLSLLQATLESTADGVLVVDREGKVTIFNLKFLALWRIPESLAESRDDSRLLQYVLDQLQNPGAFMDKVKALYNQPGAESFDVLEFKDGRVFERYSKPQRVGEEIIGRVWSFRDVTEQRQTQKALQESEKNYRLLADHASDTIWTMDMDLNFTYISPSVTRNRGYSVEEAMSQRIDEVLTPASLNLAKKVFADELALERMEPKDLSRSRTLELEQKCKNGSTVWTETTLAFIRNPGGRAIGILGVTRDISARRRAEESIRKNEETFRDLYNSAPVGYHEYDTQGRITNVNDTDLEMLGYRREEMIGQYMWKFNVEEDFARKQILEKLAGLRSPGRSLERTYRRKDGTTFPVLIEDRLIKDEQGRITGIRSTIQDITDRKQMEKAIQDSEKRYRVLVEVSSEAVILRQSDGRIVYANPAALKLLHATKQEDLVGRDYLEFVHPDDREESARRIRRGLMEGWPAPRREHRLVALDGQPIEVESTGVSFMYQGQRHILGVFHDITERKRAEKELLRLSTAITASIDGVIVVDFEGNIVDINEAVLKKQGIGHKGDMIGKKGLEFIAPEDREKLLAAMKEVREKGYIEGVEYSIVGKDDRRIPVEANAVAMKDEDGKPIGVVIIVRDVTERKEVEKSLRKSEEEARRLAKENETMAEIGRIIGSTLNIDEVYGGFAEVVKKIIPFDRIVINTINPEKNTIRNVYIAGEEVGDRKLDEVYPLEGSGNAEMVRAGSSLLIQTDDFHEYRDRFPMLYSTFQAGFRSIMNVPLFSKGKIIAGLLLRSRKSHAYTDKDVKVAERIGNQIAGAIANAVLFAEQKRAEKEKDILQEQLQQAQKMEAIGTLAGGIAHDFNNILTAILGYAELASLDLPEDSKVKDNLQQSIRAGHRAKALVQQILAFSRRGREERKPVNIKPIIKEELKFLRASLPATIEIRQDMAEDLGAIEADPTQVHQVVMNLCTNAAHAMGENGGVLRVSLNNCRVEKGTSAAIAGIEPGPYLRLRVSDTGHGMPPEILKKIFEPYFTTKEIGKGTGLGLAVVHGIVKGYGGGITVSSEVGQGSTFDVYFPWVETPKEVSVAGARESLPAGGHERILLVDDEHAVAEVVQGMLTILGYRTSARTSSIEALELFRAKPDQFDLVVTDMTMPNMTGDKLTGKLLEIRPDIPIILCTGFSEYITKEKAEGLGIRELLLKPLVMKELAQAVRRVLDSNHDKGKGANGSNPGDR
jgi:PAS domain S-box-containing protein